MPRSETIMLQRSGYESWITIHEDGVITLHVENDGYAVVHRGLEENDRVVDLAEVERVARHDPAALARIRAVLARFAPKPVPAPDIVLLRSPSSTTAELVIGEGGQYRVHQLGFSQVRSLLAQLARAVSIWPVKEL